MPNSEKRFMNEKELKTLLLHYEVHSSRFWMFFTLNDWLQDKIVDYFVWKVDSKFARFKKSEKTRQELDAIKNN